jgi:hypothetical protein
MLAKNTRLSFECPKSLSDLARTPDPAVRFCDACQQHVFDLSALTEAEALAVKAARGCDGQRACIAFRVCGDEVLVQPGPPRSATRIVLALAAAGLAIPAGAALLGSGGTPAPVEAPATPPPGAAGLSLAVEGLSGKALADDLLAESGRLSRLVPVGPTSPGDVPCEAESADSFDRAHDDALERSPDEMERPAQGAAHSSKRRSTGRPVGRLTIGLSM